MSLVTHRSLWRQACTIGMSLLILALAPTQSTLADPDAEAKPPARSEANAEAEAEAVDHGIRFDTPRRVVWAGRTQVIPFHCTSPTDADRQFTAAARHPQHLELLSRPTVLAGQSVGYVRVRGLETGKTTLTIGGTSLDIHVQSPPADPAGATPLLEQHAPLITSPTPGSVLWGDLFVTVELFHDPVQTAGDTAGVSLVLPDGDALPLVDDRFLDDGPTRQLTFALHAATLDPGPLTLTAVANWPGRTPLQSPVVAVHVAHPEPDALIADEAEALVDVPRPARYGGNREPEQRPLRVRKHKNASGGRFVHNPGARPPMSIPVTADEPGWYQVIVRAGGDFAGGAHPTVGLRVDDEPRPRTAVRLARSDWHRVAVGSPIHLEPGEHALTVYFENDFYTRGNDRNLRLDRYEILRLNQPSLDLETVLERPDDPRLAVALPPQLHDLTVSGGFRLQPRVSWDASLAVNPPTVDLLINGNAIMSQQTPRPSFDIDRGHLTAGTNTIEARATLDNGLIARSQPHTITLADFDDDAQPIARQHHHFAVTGPAWDSDTAQRLGEDGREQRRVARFHSNAAATLNLPDDLTGRYVVHIEGRGDAFDGPPEAEVTLIRGQAEIDVGTVAVTGRYRAHRVGTVELAAGSKKLRVAFINDKYDAEQKKDRNLFVEAVSLVEVAAKDAAHPTGRIVYPKPNQQIHAVDAVVVDTADDRRIAWAELILDGKPTGYRVSPSLGESRLVLPLITRELSPGKHNVAVRIADGRQTRNTDPIRIQLRRNAPDQPTAYERAVRLLHRFAYGVEPRELADLLTMGEEAYLRDRLSQDWRTSGHHAAWQWASHLYPVPNNGGHVLHRVLRYDMTSPNPVRTRLVMWVNNHFSSWMRKTRAERKVDDFARFARLGPAPFADLLLTSATSPAMLVYLDQHRSFAGRINENYAREIMELHSLGVGGGYAQQDVTQLAHLITGWTVSDEAPLDGHNGYLASTFRYTPHLNDTDGRDIFGLRLPEAEDPAQQYDRVRFAIEMLAAHPSTARYISQKLAEHYLAVPAPDKLVDDLADVFLESGGDLREVLIALAQHPAFTAPDQPARLTTPMDFAIRLGRTTGVHNSGAVIGYLNRSAVGLFDRDTPDGYPEEDQAYTDSNVTLQRWRLVRDTEWAAFRLAPAPLRNPTPPDGVDDDVWRQRLIDAIAVNLTGRPLGERSNKAAMDVLRQTSQKGNARILLIAGLIAQMPEALLR